MNHTLRPHQEALVERFHCHLQTIESIQDLFPPEGGVREPAEPPFPILPGTNKLCIDAVRKVCIANQKRQAHRDRGLVVLSQIDEVIGAA